MLFTRGDYGLWVQAAIERRSEAGTKVLAASEALTHDELAQQIGAAVGKQVRSLRIVPALTHPGRRPATAVRPVRRRDAGAHGSVPELLHRVRDRHRCAR